MGEMTTANRTNGLTAEQILVDEWIRQADRAKSMTGMDAIWFPDAEETLAVLRANGLLSEGTPSEAQVEGQDADLLHEQLNAWQDERECVSKYARLLMDSAAVRPEVAALDVGHHLQEILGGAK